MHFCRTGSVQLLQCSVVISLWAICPTWISEIWMLGSMVGLKVLLLVVFQVTGWDSPKAIWEVLGWTRNQWGAFKLSSGSLRGQRAAWVYPMAEKYWVFRQKIALCWSNLGHFARNYCEELSDTISSLSWWRIWEKFIAKYYVSSGSAAYISPLISNHRWFSEKVHFEQICDHLIEWTELKFLQEAVKVYSCSAMTKLFILLWLWGKPCQLPGKFHLMVSNLPIPCV